METVRSLLLQEGGREGAVQEEQEGEEAAQREAPGGRGEEAGEQRGRVYCQLGSCRRSQ